MPHAAQPKTSRLASALTLSAGIHVAVLCALALWLPCVGDPSEASDAEFGVVSMVTVSEPEPPPEPPEPSPPEDVTFVSLPEPAEEQVPVEADFADQFDRQVEREQVRRADGPQGLARVESRSAAQRGTAEGESERSVAHALEAAPPLPSRPADPDPQPGENAAPLPEAGQITDVAPDEAASEGQGVPDAPSPRGHGLDLTVFNPTADHPIVRPGGEPQEFLELEQGDRTLLNSHQNIYWTFFDRLRRQIAAEWSPQQVYNEHDPHHVYYRQIDRYTVIDLTLDGRGDLESAVVHRTSGLDFLDQEAIRAIREGAPFRNVPEGLKDERGRVDVRFGFMLSFDYSTSVRRIPTR